MLIFSTQHYKKPLSLLQLAKKNFAVSRNRNVRGTGGGGRLHPQGGIIMAISGLKSRKALIGTGWVISLLLCMNGLRKQSFVLEGASMHF